MVHTLETLATVATRCTHDGERGACPFCDTTGRATVASGAGTRNVHSADMLARALRATLARRVALVREIRGYRFLSGTVSASGATSPVLRGISATSQNIGDAFYSDVTGETLQRFARYIGDGANVAALQRVLLSDGSPVSYASRLAGRMARDICVNTGTGRGTMPYFARDVADVLRALRDRYRDALPDVPAFTIGDTTCPVHGANGCPLPTWDVSPDGMRDRIGDGCERGTVAALPVLPRRRMSYGERALIVRTFRPERGERSPLFAQWRDGHGDTLPDVADGHNAGTLAHNVPERDASPLQRGTLWERFAASGASGDTLRALRVAWDLVNVPDGRGRFTSRVAWGTVAETLGHTGKRDGDRIGRDVRRVARALLNRERGDVLRDAPHTVPVVPRPVTFTVARPTGNVPRNVRTGEPFPRGEYDTSPVVFPLAPYAWKRDTGTVARLQRDGTVTVEREPIALVPVTRPTHDTGGALWHVAPCPCDVAETGTHGATCDVRRDRARRVAQWDAIGPRTGRATVRALVDGHTRERAHGAS